MALAGGQGTSRASAMSRSEEHTSELQSPDHLVCRLLLEKKKKEKITKSGRNQQKLTNANTMRVEERNNAAKNARQIIVHTHTHNDRAVYCVLTPAASMLT